MRKIVLILSIVSLWWANALAQDFKIIPMKSTIAEELFQTYVVVDALKALGYKTESIKELDYPVLYKTMAQNANSKDVYFTPTNWTPLHDNMLTASKKENFFQKGVFIANCAQGYLIDKKTADKYKIKYINDLKDPKLAKLFDINGDGKADLAGCNPGWGCAKVINHQLDAFKLRDTIQHNQGEYSAIMAQSFARFKKGEPILYYTWSPYWISGKLVPGRDVVWLQVTKTAHPSEKDTSLPNGDNYGFNINNQIITANASIAKNHPDIAKLFEIIKIPVDDVNAQNMLMAKGEKKDKDIKNHAKSWIKTHKKEFDLWINEAKKAKK